MTNARKALTLSVALCLMSTTMAHAYVDPGSGSVIITTILGLFAAVGYTCRKYFYRMKRVFAGQGPDDTPGSET